MKKRFTRIMAAMMLLVTLAIPMGMRGQTTYEQLTSIANIDESAQYVLGIDGTGFHYEGTSSWGKTALPSAQTPIYYTLTKATDGNSFTAHATISGTTYYLQIPTSNTFSMATSTGTNTDIIIGTTQVSGTNYAVANKTTTTRHLRINGTSGLRSYASTTGTMAFFYKVVTSSSNTYTVTFDAGDGTFVGNTDFPNTSNTKPAGTYNLPSATPATGYTFDGWTATGISTPITGSYTVSSNIEFTAQYTQNSGSGTVTATLTQSNLELTGSYSSNTSKTIDGITYVHTDLMKNNSNIQAKASTGTIKNTTAYPGDITSVAITHSGTARATTINGSADGTNWTQVATGSGSITADFSGRGYKYFQITRGSNAAYWEKIDITYSTTSSSLTDSDLAITNASTTLSFDLYNNSAAQTITYTTSSTGSITITPASPTEYFSYVHDATAKTITVTPTAVTPSAQTVTINQAADDNYAAGSKTFTINITDSTPFTGGDVTFVAGRDMGTTTATGPDSMTKQVVTISSTNAAFGYSDNYRMYKNSVTTISTSTGVITSITFTQSGNYSISYLTPDCGTLSDGTWTGSAASIEFTNDGTDQTRATQIAVTVDLGGTPAPSITASDVDITYDATSGEIEYTITNPATNGNLTVSENVDWISNAAVNTSESKVTFTTTANEATTSREGVITLTYTYGNNETVTKDVTITQAAAPVIYTTIPALFEAATSTETNVFVTFNNWVVSGVNGNQSFVTDGTNGFIMYQSGHGFKVGNVLSGTANCNLVLFHSSAEITGLTSTSEGLTVGNNGSVTPVVTTIDALQAVNTGSVVTLSNLTYNGTNLSDGTNNIQYYTSLYNGTTLESGKIYNITGIFVLYDDTKRILPRSADDIVELVPTTITLDVPGYGTSAGGYHLIASPLATSVAPTAVTNMIDATTPANYDLYRFNQNEEFEWQNYKGHTDGFVIEPGKAYLYAHNTNVTLTFNGIAYNGNGTFNLTQSATNNTSNGGKMNAVGNPFNATASIGSRSFYKMNADGTALEAVVGGTIGALEGIVVNYDANNPSVTFSTSKSRDVIELLTLNLQEQDNVIDNVIVRFDGGDQLLKYQIFDSSKIYVTVDGEDYAVVRGENQGTLPVNFLALSNGTYTISMDFENMTFSYLHLIDNLTGEDIDMLTTTSYSFDATTEDNANRFTLVYSKDGEGTTETLTFYDGDATSGYVPVYGFYADAYQKVEFIMPAEDLYALTGGTINKMTWYLTTPAEDAWGGNFKIYLMETEATTPTDYANLTNATLVYDGPLDGTGETLEINFATSFFYEGNNLLVAVHQTETGTYKSATFAGSAVTGAALQGYNYSSLNQVNQAVRDFLPKTTFEFTPGSGAIYYKPKQLQASEIGITSAVLTWEAGDDETSWGVEYKKVTEDTWTDAGTVDQLTITLDNLEAGTEYEAHVKSIYTDGESGWTTIAFATEACEETDKGEVAYTLTDNYGDGWTNNKLKIFLSGTDIMIAELTLTTGWELEGVVKLCYDTDYDLVWVAGSYAYETGFVLTAPDGTIIYEFHGTGNSGGTTPTPGVLTTFQIHNGFTKTIEAYTDNSGYYLIASPVGNVLASNVTNMVDGNYDLYMFDQTGDDEGKQWLNYKANAFSYLEVGLGYLYASESDVTLTFSGTPISSDDDYAVEVNYNASSDFPGLNLLGNPFAEEAYLVNAEGNGLAYHRLNPANNTYVTVDDNSAIPMMEGVFYEAGENDDVVYFSATAPATSKSNLNITVSQGRGMVDNAIVRFGEGNTLRKISLRDNSTKVYIPQNGSEYALVNANEFGEMPVNFKAESNGTYTMNFSNQNVEFGYLHLIDNLTGADVDLLANPSYSFEAKVSDYASRFKLVFATGNDDSSSDFAFVSNDEIIVNGEGMLQVIDMTGRIISTSQVNGMSSIKLNAAAGVYVLRLNDKTQKIVIR